MSVESFRSAHTPVDMWLTRSANDPRLPALTALCEIIEASDPRIVGEIKWNAPSYRIVDHFATTGLAPKSGVRLVLHTGAKKRDEPLTIQVDDPLELLDWKAPDRAVAMFRTLEEVAAARDALEAILTRWIDQTQGG